MDSTTATTSQTVAAATSKPATYPVDAFDGCERLAEINRLLVDYIRYQSQVRIEAALNLPPLIHSADSAARAQIIRCLKDEHRRLEGLKRLINNIDQTNEDLIHEYEDPPVDLNTWGDAAPTWQ
jgi:uncharacterized membrane protein YccC